MAGFFGILSRNPRHERRTAAGDGEKSKGAQKHLWPNGHKCVRPPGGHDEVAIASTRHSAISRATVAGGGATPGASGDYITRSSALTGLVGFLPTAPTLDVTEVRKWTREIELNDTRKNGRLCDKYIVALPIELSPDQHEQLLSDFMGAIGQNRIAWFAGIHAGGADTHNPHAHIMFRDKDLTTGRVVVDAGRRIADENGKMISGTQRLRDTWVRCVNDALERAGSNERIDGRSYADQGLTQEPTMHLGATANAQERRGERTERGDANRKINALNAARQIVQIAAETRVRLDQEPTPEVVAQAEKIVAAMEIRLGSEPPEIESESDYDFQLAAMVEPPVEITNKDIEIVDDEIEETPVLPVVPVRRDIEIEDEEIEETHVLPVVRDDEVVFALDSLIEQIQKSETRRDLQITLGVNMPRIIEGALRELRDYGEKTVTILVEAAQTFESAWREICATCLDTIDAIKARLAPQITPAVAVHVEPPPPIATVVERVVPAQPPIPDTIEMELPVPTLDVSETALSDLNRWIADTQEIAVEPQTPVPTAIPVAKRMVSVPLADEIKRFQGNEVVKQILGPEQTETLRNMLAQAQARGIKSVSIDGDQAGRITTRCEAVVEACRDAIAEDVARRGDLPQKPVTTAIPNDAPKPQKQVVEVVREGTSREITGEYIGVRNSTTNGVATPLAIVRDAKGGCLAFLDVDAFAAMRLGEQVRAQMSPDKGLAITNEASLAQEAEALALENVAEMPSNIEMDL